VLRIFFLQLASLWLPYPFVGGVVIYSHFPIEPRCWISLVEIWHPRHVPGIVALL